MSKALIYSISRYFVGPTPDLKSTGKDTGSDEKSIGDQPAKTTASAKTRHRSTPPPESRKNALSELPPRPSLKETVAPGPEQGKVTHRTSRSRVRSENRHPFFLSRSRGAHRSHSNSNTVCSSTSTACPIAERLPSAESIELDFVVNSEKYRDQSSTRGGHFLKYPQSLRSHSGSRSRDQSRVGRRIMWEDSGYDSPSLRTDSRYNNTGHKSNRSGGNGQRGISPISARYDPGLSPTRFDAGQRGHSPPPTRYRYDPAQRSIVSQQLRSSLRSVPAPKQDSAGSKPYTSRNARSEGGLRGMSPKFTSTPIKASSTAVYQLFTETDSLHDVLPNNEPETLLLNASTASAALQQHFERQTSTSSLVNATSSSVKVVEGYETFEFGLPSSKSATEMKQMFDETMSRILQDGNSEFDEKYGRWIQQVFQLQLAKMQTRLTQTFTMKLDSIVKTKEQHFTEIQRQYRNKLLEFEAATEKFQAWIDTLSKENEKLKVSKDAIISELKHREATAQQRFKLELDRQANEIQAEAEKEKLKVQRRHADQLRAVSDKSMDQVSQLEEQYKRQVDSLQMLVTELKAQIVGLENELEFSRNTSGRHSLIDARSVHSANHEREQILRLVTDLRQKLAEAEREKTVLASAHNEEIAELQSISDSRKKHMTKQITKSQTIIQNLEAEHQAELTEMEKRLQEQEKANQKAIDELRQTYGTKINELTATVEGLRRKQFASVF